MTCPCIRRYLGALIETSMPTVALALHIDSMGSGGRRSASWCR